MRTIRPTEVLDYYDGIEIFAGRDSIGGHYIALIVDSMPRYDRYLVAGVAPERLRQFRTGAVDLRALLLEAPDGEWYITNADVAYGEPLTLQPQDGPIPEKFLPEAGFTLDDGPTDDLAVQEARARGNVVFEFSVRPPETAGGHRIRAATLGSLLAQMQNLVRHAYHSARSELPRQERRRPDADDGSLLNVVVPAMPGSFRVVLEAAAPPDMFASNDLALALSRLDAVFQSAKNPGSAPELLKPYRGHLTGAYVKLLRFLADNQTGLDYSWADNISNSAKYGGVSEAAARELAELLSGNVSLTEAEVDLVGEFRRMNLDTDGWGLSTDEGLKTGRIAPGAQVSLAGLTAGERYRFHCREDVEMDIWGQEKITLYLKGIEPVN